MFINNKISQEEEKRKACPSEKIFNFVATDDNVSVETEGNEKNMKVEPLSKTYSHVKYVKVNIRVQQT